MTLIVVFPANDGIIVGSDTQITQGYTRYTDIKIHNFSDNCVWAGAGSDTILQPVKDAFDEMPNDIPLDELHPDISKSITDSMTKVLNLDMRSRWYQDDIDSLLKLHEGEFVFAQYKDDKSHIVHFLNNGSFEVIKNRPYAIGSGAVFAFALLSKYHNESLDSDMASVVVYDVLEEAISVGAYGVGFPIDVCKIDKNGISELDKPTLASNALILREKEKELVKNKIWNST
ncbi:hypothetical protein [Methanoregula sp. PtaB.Bin085]|uniref:hypothetical protein n=1 Tax=Methanoregula sp. PtaB.Bin085 TaxID=1811680 RepID=UPI0009C929F0|nr:hypothetical protein [Methanoregula sp. PtaB.Bin085]OPX63468.1 MAG: Proteasome subunit beta [Methanoregula sp. PtaB.Bin085]